jgi:circadian clock protein KaiC
MLGGKGYYRGSTVLISGTAGSGKTSLASHFVNAACERGERCLYIGFEESPQQIVRNMKSIGLDLDGWVKKGLLSFHAARSTVYGLEMHLVTIHKMVRDLQPEVVILDPIGNLTMAGSELDTTSMLTRLMDFLKSQKITAVWTSLTSGNDTEKTDVGISSLVDTWLLLRDMESGGERNRAMYILKSRGMAHSNQIREFLLTDHGIELTDVYLGPQGVLTGSARQTQEAKETAEALVRQQAIAGKQRELERKRQALEATISAMRAEFEAEKEEAVRIIGEEQLRDDALQQDRRRMSVSRKAEVAGQTSSRLRRR